MSQAADTHRETATVFLAGIAIFAAQAAILLWMGQPSAAPAGSGGLWGAGPSTSLRLFDWYTGSHFVHGFLFYWLTWLVLPRWSVGRRGVVAMVIEAAWEVVENTPWVIDRYRDVTVSGDYVGDTVLNSVFDLWAMLVGFWMAAKLPVWLTVALAIALEVGALVAIRDNLTLNVLMLLYPIEAIRIWQAG